MLQSTSGQVKLSRREPFIIRLPVICLPTSRIYMYLAAHQIRLVKCISAYFVINLDDVRAVCLVLGALGFAVVQVLYMTG